MKLQQLSGTGKLFCCSIGCFEIAVAMSTIAKRTPFCRAASAQSNRFFSGGIEGISFSIFDGLNARDQQRTIIAYNHF